MPCSCQNLPMHKRPMLRRIWRFLGCFERFVLLLPHKLRLSSKTKFLVSRHDLVASLISLLTDCLKCRSFWSLVTEQFDRFKVHPATSVNSRQNSQQAWRYDRIGGLLACTNRNSLVKDEEPRGGDLERIARATSLAVVPHCNIDMIRGEFNYLLEIYPRKSLREWGSGGYHTLNQMTPKLANERRATNSVSAKEHR